MQQVVYPFVSVPIPGDKAKKIIQIDDAYMMTATKASPLAIKRGEGIVLEDEDGNIFYDFTSGVGVCNTGTAIQRLFKQLKNKQRVSFILQEQIIIMKCNLSSLKLLLDLLQEILRRKYFLQIQGQNL
jgi:acetylornithine/succinyldiaminopimelate/putrescine aminotransferase